MLRTGNAMWRGGTTREPRGEGLGGWAPAAAAGAFAVDSAASGA